jgi:hypothetical protein
MAGRNRFVFRAFLRMLGSSLHFVHVRHFLSITEVYFFVWTPEQRSFVKHLLEYLTSMVLIVLAVNLLATQGNVRSCPLPVYYLLG